MVEILLIGSMHSHTDPDTFSKLERELNAFRPDTVIFEGTKQKYENDLFNYYLILRLLRRAKAPENFVVQAAESFRLDFGESIAIRDYCLKAKARLVHFGDEYIVESKYQIERETTEMVCGLVADVDAACMYLPEIRAQKRELARKCWKKFMNFVDNRVEEKWSVTNDWYYGEKGIWHRDAVMEQTLRKEIKKNPERMAAVNGFSHLIKDARKISLYSRIQDLNTRRIFLYK